MNWALTAPSFRSVLQRSFNRCLKLGLEAEPGGAAGFVDAEGLGVAGDVGSGAGDVLGVGGVEEVVDSSGDAPCFV